RIVYEPGGKSPAANGITTFAPFPLARLIAMARGEPNWTADASIDRSGDANRLTTMRVWAAAPPALVILTEAIPLSPATNTAGKCTGLPRPAGLAEDVTTTVGLVAVGEVLRSTSADVAAAGVARFGTTPGAASEAITSGLVSPLKSPVARLTGAPATGKVM